MSASASALPLNGDSPGVAAAPHTTPRTVMPTFFLTHGGGPSYFMEVPPDHPFFSISSKSSNAQWLRDFTKLYRLDGANTPKAIVVVSAHWPTSGKTVRVTSQVQHTKLLYDYGGFPEETYEIGFAPKGDPALSQRIVELLGQAGIPAELNSKWKFDHGVFIPLKMIWPEADVPVVELSIDRSWDPAWHLSVGRALQDLKNEGVVVIGSGSITHNFNPNGPRNKIFVDAIQKLVEDRSLNEDELAKKAVLDWTKIPAARDAHPKEDHFVPFFVALGAAGGQKGELVGRVDPPGDFHLASFYFDSNL